MGESGKPKCGTCGGTKGRVGDATPIDTSMIPSSCTSGPISKCECESPLFDACDDSPCLEDHTKTFVKKQFGYTLKVRNSFNWPADGDDVELSVKDVTSLLPGTMLWNPTVGYLYVQTFDPATQRLTARNRGDSCNVKAAGDLIPSCVDFVVGPVPCGGGGIVPPGSTVPYLSADFISPAEGECAIAKVTTIVGLQLGDIVSITSYQYTIDPITGIIDSTTIKLCNTGDGAPEGTVIQADPDCNGVPDVPILVISSTNPCILEPVHAGILIGCVEGHAKPITGLITGQILVWNSETNRWELATVNIPEGECTTLTSELALDPDHVGSYLVTVADSSIFTAPGKVEIDGNPDGTIFDVNDIVDPTHIHVTPDFVVNSIYEYETGEVICVADCCIQIQENIDNLPFAGAGGNLLGDGFSVGPVDDDSHTTPAMTFSVTNPSPTKPMKLQIILKLFVTGEVGAVLGDLISTRFALQYTTNGGPPDDVHIATSMAIESDGGCCLKNDVEVVQTIFHILAPLAVENYSVVGIITKLSTGSLGAGENDGEYIADGTLLTYTYLGIPG